jgi:AcrR family transcriptional regulator
MTPTATRLIAVPGLLAPAQAVRQHNDALPGADENPDQPRNERIRPGRHDGARLRERVAAAQRERLRHAMLALAGERGLHGCTIAALTTRAGVSRGAFYQLYDDLPACFLDTLAVALDRTIDTVTRAFEREASWPDGVLGALAALLALLDADPPLARICLHEALAGRPDALRLRAQSLATLQPLLDAGRSHTPPDRSPPALTAEATIGAVAAILHTRLTTGEAPPFGVLLGPLAEIALTPYLDASALAQTLDRVELHTRRAEPPEARGVPRHADTLPPPLNRPSAHRARAAVRHLAVHPGASNGQIAASLGIRNPAQVSALLARLHRHELLTKQAGGAGRPNAWALTSAGEQAARTLAVGW